MIALEKFALAGNATFTATSRKTGTRFTFRVRKPSDQDPRFLGARVHDIHFVSLMNGPDNENSYCFLGTIFDGQTYRHGRKSRVGQDAPSAKAFTWIWNHRNDPTLPESVEIHHEGRCCCCGRKLTTPESCESGIGPICADKA
jgi:hypothetical protein